MSEQTIGDLIQTADKPVIFGAETGCPRCTQLKADADRAGIEYIFLDVRANFDAYTHLKTAGYTSIPQIFQSGRRVGDNIKALLGVAA